MTVVTSEEVRKGGKLGRGGEGDHEATWKSGVFMLFTAYTTGVNTNVQLVVATALPHL